MSKSIDGTTPSVSMSNVTGVLPIQNGGTNSSTVLNNGLVMCSSGGQIVESALAPSQVVDLNSTQSITGIKTYSALVLHNGTSGYNAAILNYYENYITSVNFGGPWASPINALYGLTRVGNIINLFINTTLLANATSMAYISSAIPIPSRFMPENDVCFPVTVLDNGSPLFGTLKVGANGIITISNSASALSQFTGSGSSGIANGTVSVTYSA